MDSIQNNVIDLSTVEGRIAHLGDVAKEADLNGDIHKANKWARNAKEVIVEGEIPCDKIKSYTCKG